VKVYSGTKLVAESPTRDPVEAAQVALRDLAAPTREEPAAAASLELESVRLYAETGSLAQVSRQLGIAIYQLQKLQRTQWWQDELAALQRESAAIKNAQLTRIHNHTLEQLIDRVEHGDVIAHGRGFIRQPVSGKDLARISEAIFRQRQLLAGLPTEIVHNKKLETLASKLRALGRKDVDAAASIVEAEDARVSESHPTLSRIQPEDAGEVLDGDVK